ncbi:interleukin-1 receptor type 2-like [Crotalus adamanteus]|uniref:Interleukin-1 receptor type 2-like n=1 Tax=Crotalus adamanteus TaxID=8729 RepID=A0AAW1BLH4_CROAD
MNSELRQQTKHRRSPPSLPLSGSALPWVSLTRRQKIRVSCQGVTAHPESGIMYWLANGTFVDQLYPNGSVKEEPTVEKGSQLTRCLIFSPLRAQDLHTSFECVITDPSGVFRKAIQWDYPDNKKEWKPSSPRLVRRAQERASAHLPGVAAPNETCGGKGGSEGPHLGRGGRKDGEGTAQAGQLRTRRRGTKNLTQFGNRDLRVLLPGGRG